MYSAGCLLFELLTGRPPFTGDTPVAIAYQHVREQPLPPSTYDDELSPEIDAIAMKALTKSLADRYQSAAAMKSDIDRCLAGQPVTAPAVAPTNWPTEVVAATDTNPATTAMLPAATNRPPAPVDLEPKRRKRTGLWVSLAVGLVVLLTAAAVFLPRLWNQAPPEVLVPDVTNSNQVLATATLQDAKLKVGQITEATSDTVKEGDVISTDPEAGTSVPENSTVDLVISTGKPAVTLPDDMIGRPGSEVEAELIALGLRVKVIPQESDLPLDQVISTSPAEGEQVAANGRVKLYVSDGPETVPDLVGKTQAEAEQLILAAGFKPHVVENPNSIEPAGTVIHQSPSVGQTLFKQGQR
ncbi:MAG: PASTA domain-containing protein [Marmoricola sp.]